MPSPLRPFLDGQGFVVLDGGLATTLEAEGHVLETQLWSAQLLRDAPDAVRSVHAAFLAAGADCITTATYQATLPGLGRIGVDAARAERLIRRSVDLAVEARDEFWSSPDGGDRLPPIIAASVGPYGAYLADGSEYDGGYALGPGGVGRGELAAFHRSKLEILADTAADVLAIETVPSLPEVEVLVDLLSEARHPGAWISFSCRDGGRLWDGSGIEDAVRACVPEAGVVAVGVNCTSPVHVTSLVRRMREATDLPILAYPNSGERYDPRTGEWRGQAVGSDWLARVPEWIQVGARAVGGCCRVGPDAIREIRRLMTEVGVQRDMMERGHRGPAREPGPD